MMASGGEQMLDVESAHNEQLWQELFQVSVLPVCLHQAALLCCILQVHDPSVYMFYMVYIIRPDVGLYDRRRSTW